MKSDAIYLWVDGVRIELNFRNPAGVRELLGGVGKKEIGIVGAEPLNSTLKAV